MANVRHGRVGLTALLAGVVVIAGPAQMARAFESELTGGGMRVTLLDKDAIGALNKERTSQMAQRGPRWEYTTTHPCSIDNAGRDCAIPGCVTGSRSAYKHIVSRRMVGADGSPVAGANGQSQTVGSMCLPELLPAAATGPSVADVRRLFRQIAFARGGLKIEPVGNVTLVNLATYFEVAFPAEGHEPNEVYSGNLGGHRVQIQPVLRSINYVFGDGHTSGPTTSRGGPYPEGDVTHTYKQPGTVTVRADVTYTGRFRVDGGQWNTIPDSMTITGTPQALDVRETPNRLVR